MKKQKIALLLSLFWLLGLVASFSFSPAAKIGIVDKVHQSELSELFSPELTIRSSGEAPEVPGFKANWSFADFISSDDIKDRLPIGSQYFSPAIFKKSKPLFDVLITFFYFFYTW